MTPDERKARVREFYNQVINSRNVDALDDFVTSDFVDHNPPPGIPGTSEGVRQTFRLFATAFPDMRLDVHDMVAEGDTVVSRVTITGTHKGEFMGMEPTGKAFSQDGIDIIRFDGDRAAERWGQFDDLGMMQQLGLAPPMG